MKFKLLMLLSVASLKGYASELIHCEVRYVDKAGATNLAGSYHQVGEYTLQDCAGEAEKVRSTQNSVVNFAFTHYTQAPSIHTPGSGWKVTTKEDEDSKDGSNLIYTEI